MHLAVIQCRKCWSIPSTTKAKAAFSGMVSFRTIHVQMPRRPVSKAAQQGGPKRRKRLVSSTISIKWWWFIHISRKSRQSSSLACRADNDLDPSGSSGDTSLGSRALTRSDTVAIWASSGARPKTSDNRPFKKTAEIESKPNICSLRESVPCQHVPAIYILNLPPSLSFACLTHCNVKNENLEKKTSKSEPAKSTQSPKMTKFLSKVTVHHPSSLGDLAELQRPLPARGAKQALSHQPLTISGTVERYFPEQTSETPANPCHRHLNIFQNLIRRGWAFRILDVSVATIEAIIPPYIFGTLQLCC